MLMSWSQLPEGVKPQSCFSGSFIVVAEHHKASISFWDDTLMETTFLSQLMLTALPVMVSSSDTARLLAAITGGPP